MLVRHGANLFSRCPPRRFIELASVLDKQLRAMAFDKSKWQRVVKEADAWLSVKVLYLGRPNHETVVVERVHELDILDLVALQGVPGTALITNGRHFQTTLNRRSKIGKLTTWRITGLLSGL